MSKGEYQMKTVLLVDDSTTLLMSMKAILEKAGYAVETATGGDAALKKLATLKPSILITDLNMPGMAGIEFVRHLVEINYTGSLILISGEDERMLQTAEKLVQAHKIHVLGHLHKPVKKEVLSELMERWTPTTQVYPPIIKKLYTGDELRAAIDNVQLVNYYQPKVSVSYTHLTLPTIYSV